MNKKIVLRVDDRLIHGQVIEGWIKYFKINHIILVSDKIAENQLQQMIYTSILPSGCKLEVLTKDYFSKLIKKIKTKKVILILFETVADLYTYKDSLTEDMLINIGCVASREHKIEISDTVFLDKEEINMLCELRKKFDIQIKKLPWETSIEIKNFAKFLEGEL
jgi:mannose/fructose/N-acetylgalactosamine-specific phosphotransferase system component IIB